MEILPPGLTNVSILTILPLSILEINLSISDKADVSFFLPGSIAMSLTRGNCHHEFVL